VSLEQKYPRTPHLPWSQPDKTDLPRQVNFDPDLEVVVTEKLDGENTSIYSGGRMHARSMDSRDHQSRHWLKGQAAGFIIHPAFVVLGENVYAKHSIHYDSLGSWFYVFGIRSEREFLAWDLVTSLAGAIPAPVVPVLWRGRWGDFYHDAIWPRPSAFGPECEGYVVRNAGAFPVEAFQQNVAKFVRPNHVQTDKHWMHTRMVVNGRR
jgi:hypothetical protein